MPYPRCDHPSNTKLYCRAHHLLRPFYRPGGWTIDNCPTDGHLHPLTGHAYTTEPHGGMLFPALGQSTGELTIPVQSTSPTPTAH